ncbi:diguanylate cyclase [Nodosilinea sp. P-1105]|uniref:diguanylate cyclase domain-containing protein n=1 Tax=Nodosilinea sp. P-1105 TaxID=2546229 RepID=UPI00146F919F|nr:diguanylate cyclase [Nodosilinea sp. P-1105]
MTISCTSAPAIGITLFPQDGANLTTLLRHADQALYQAKILTNRDRNQHQNSHQQNGCGP